MNCSEAIATVEINPADHEESPKEKLAYCPHCLKPFKPSHEGRYAEYAFDNYLGPDTNADLREIAAKLILAGERKSGLAIISLEEQHVCSETCPVSTGQEGTIFPWEMLDSNGQNIIFCPECHGRIHKGEGPLTARGMKIELGKRLQGQSAENNQDDVDDVRLP